MEQIHIPQNQPNNKIKKAIVLVHGLGGSRSSWIGNKNRFVENLIANSTISENFSVYIFEYPTSIFAPFTFIKRILSLLPVSGSKRKERKKKFNVGIRKIALQLATDIREVLAEYDSISIISHSMGGLISKRAFVELGEEVTKVSLYISLSVPHRGAILASIGKALLGNPQLIDLQGFSEFTNDLTNAYSNLAFQPKAVYQSGNQDEVVNEGSAIPAGVLSKDRIDTGDNHFTVLQVDKPTSNSTFSRILKELEIVNNELSSNFLANAPINFSLPINWTFQDTAKALVETTKSTISFERFSKKELNLKLRPNEISKENTFRALESLKHIGIQTIPDYEIIVEKSHFKIVKL